MKAEPSPLIHRKLAANLKLSTGLQQAQNLSPCFNFAKRIIPSVRELIAILLHEKSMKNTLRCKSDHSSVFGDPSFCNNMTFDLLQKICISLGMGLTIPP